MNRLDVVVLSVIYVTQALSSFYYTMEPDGDGESWLGTGEGRGPSCCRVGALRISS